MKPFDKFSEESESVPTDRPLGEPVEPRAWPNTGPIPIRTAGAFCYNARGPLLAGRVGCWRVILRIVVTNDDGVNAPGLWASAEALSDLGEVFVIAPDRNMSGVGTAMTLMNVVRVQDVPSPVAGVKAWSVQGTPADCVILASEKLLDGTPDLIVSGINHGANLGMDVMVSGTVGGAFQGYFRNIPSMAVSVFYRTEVRYEAAALVTRALARTISNNRMPSPLLLNVNVPSLAPEEIEQAELTRLGPATYLENVEQGIDGNKRTHYWIRHNRQVGAEVQEGTDVWAVRNRRVSITPLNVSFSSETPSSAFGVLADAVAAALDSR